MSDTLAIKDSPTKMVGKPKTSHWCEFTKTWPYPEICITCGGEAPELYDSDTCSSGDANETRTDNPVITDTAKSEKIDAAVRSKPFCRKSRQKEEGCSTQEAEGLHSVKAAKKRKVVPSKKPKKAIKMAMEMDEFYKKLFKDYPLFLPASPPFSDGQINEFLCQHCGRHKELDDEAWNACPYAIFHGLIKDESDQLGDQLSVSSSSPNPEPKKSEEKSNKKEDE